MTKTEWDALREKIVAAARREDEIERETRYLTRLISSLAAEKKAVTARAAIYRRRFRTLTSLDRKWKPQ